MHRVSAETRGAIAYGASLGVGWPCLICEKERDGTVFVLARAAGTQAPVVKRRSCRPTKPAVEVRVLLGVRKLG